LPHFGVHSPHQAKKKLVKHFEDKPAAGGHHDPTYAAMIASVDESVGRVLEKLEELNLAENTLVIFTADNGGVGGYQRAGLDKDGITDNAPLKGGKGMLFEGGVRVAYIFKWKGKIEPGQTNATPIISVDLYPTLLEVAGADPPADYTLDGESYAGLLTGEKQSLARDAIYWHFPGYLGASGDQWRTKPTGSIRAGDWKLLERFEDGELELYNLKDDIGESKNLAEAEPERAQQLHEKLIAWRASVGAKMPKANDGTETAKQPKAKGKKNKNKRKRERERAT
jgi:arylsulfatase A-like enzyme